MASGENSAKETLYDEAESMAKSLTNGKAADPEFHGHALAFLIRSLKPLFLADFVTRGDLVAHCNKHHPPKKKQPSFFHVPNLPTALTLIASVYGVIKLVIYIIDKT